MTKEPHGEATERTENPFIEMPGPSYWPMVLAFGLALLFAGVLTHYLVGVTGLIISLRAARGWWGDVIPAERHELVPVNVALRPAPIEAETRSVVRLKAGEDRHRISVPEQIHPYSSGFWGGLCGGAVMAILACLYGLIAQHSIWYPVNLLAGVVLPGIGNAGLEQLRAFNALAFAAALVGHVTISILVGIIYAAILPMFPKYALFWGGILVPLFWTGLTATTLNVVNPALNRRINWYWFVASQLAYGLVAGFVIARSTNISTMQSWDFASRAFVHAPGLQPPRDTPPEGK
jgi:hypothetical protein